MKRYLIDSKGRNQEINFISEGDMYRLIAYSKLESAERFEIWVFDEVLPTLRKIGSYEIPKHKSQFGLLSLSSASIMVKNVIGSLECARVEPAYIAAEVKRLYSTLGYEIMTAAVILPDLTAEPKKRLLRHRL